MRLDEDDQRAQLAHVLDILICITSVYDRGEDEQQQARAARGASRNGRAIRPQTADERREKLVRRVRRALALSRQGNRDRSKAA